MKKNKIKKINNQYLLKKRKELRNKSQFKVLKKVTFLCTLIDKAVENKEKNSRVEEDLLYILHRLNLEFREKPLSK